MILRGKVEPGTIVAERFEVLARAGAGGMGVVVRALDRESGHHVALKVMIEGSTELGRFEREARVLAALRHPSIVGHVGHGTTDAGLAWLAMEWLDGEDLGQRLARGGLSLYEAIDVAERVAAALAAAHAQGIVHRDVKPNNVFLEAREAARARLLDFGIARRRGVDTRVATGTGVIIGTPAYMAPEQARADRDVDLRADLYSLGAVLYHCLIGAPPFEADGAMALLARVILDDAPRARIARPDLPEELDELVAALLAKSPAARPATADDVLSRLARIRRGIEALPLERRGAPGAPTRPPALSAGEQRVVCVVLASDTARPSLPPGPPEEAHDLLDREAQATSVVVVGPVDDAIEALRARHLGPDVRVERLGDAALLCVFAGASAEEVVRAARVALALRALLPTFAVSVASGRGTLSEHGPVGEVVARAAERARVDGDSSPAIHVDDTVAALLEGLFVLEGAPDRRELLGERDDDEARPVLGARTPCLGRERELGLLSATFDEVCDEGVARAVLISGPPGCGKSRVRREQLAALANRAEPPIVWRALGDPLGVESSLATMAALLRGGLAVSAGAAAADVLRRRVAELDASIPEPLVEQLCELVETGAPGANDARDAAARSDPSAIAERIRDAVVALARAVARRGPLVIAIEDAQWADGATLQLLDVLLRDLSSERLLVIAYARPSIHERFPKLWSGRSVTEIRLAPLGRRVCERLVLRVLGPETPAELVARLVDRADGNPFYLEELMRAARAGRGELPESVVAAIQARLSVVGSDARRVLRAASVLGERFWARPVATMVGHERGVAERLAELSALELVAPDGQSRFEGELQYRFTHALVRDAVYATLTEEDRRLAHRVAAGWLAEVGEDPARLAVHWEEAGELGAAARCLLPSIEGALVVGDVETGEGLIARARRLLLASGAEDRATEAWLAAWSAEVAHRRHDLRGALAQARFAMERSEPAEEAWAQGAMLAAIMAARLGEHSTLEELRRALVRRAVDEHALTHRARAALARQSYLSGRDVEGDEMIAAVGRPLEELERSDPYAAGLIHGARVHRTAGPDDLHTRFVHAARAVELARANADQIALAYSIAGQTVVLADYGHWEDCRRILETEILGRPERRALRVLCVGAEALLARARTELGEGGDAAEVIERCVEEYARAGDRRRVVAFEMHLAAVVVGVDEPRAARLFDRAEPDFEGVRANEVAFYYQRARHRLGRGDHVGARRDAEHVKSIPASGCLLGVDVGARAVLAELTRREEGEHAGRLAQQRLASYARARLSLIATADAVACDKTMRGLREVRLALAAP